MMLYICTKICENISKVPELLSGHFLHTEIYKGENYIKTVGGAVVLAFCTSSDGVYIRTKLRETV